MQDIFLNTILSPLSIASIEFVKTNTSFLKIQESISKMALFLTIIALCLTSFTLFFSASIVLSFIVKVEFFWSRFFLRYFFFLLWRVSLADLLVHDGMEVFPLANFNFLGLNFLNLDFLILYIWTFKKVTWDRR